MMKPEIHWYKKRFSHHTEQPLKTYCKLNFVTLIYKFMNEMNTQSITWLTFVFFSLKLCHHYYYVICNQLYIWTEILDSLSYSIHYLFFFFGLMSAVTAVWMSDLKSPIFPIWDWQMYHLSSSDHENKSMKYIDNKARVGENRRPSTPYIYYSHHHYQRFNES